MARLFIEQFSKETNCAYFDHSLLNLTSACIPIKQKRRNDAKEFINVQHEF